MSSKWATPISNYYPSPNILATNLGDTKLLGTSPPPLALETPTNFAISSIVATPQASASSSIGSPVTLLPMNTASQISMELTFTNMLTHAKASKWTGALSTLISAATKCATSSSPMLYSGSISFISMASASMASPPCFISTTPASPASGSPINTVATKISKPSPF